MAEPGEQRLRAVERDQRALVDDRHPVAQALRLVKVVRRDQDRELLTRPQAGDHVEQLVADAGVEPDGRFVEEQDLGLRAEGACDLQAPAFAAAVGVDGAVDQSDSPSASMSSFVGAWLCAGVRPRAACGARGWRGRVRPRSTTASWKTTLDMLLAKQRRLRHVVAGEPGRAGGRDDRRGQHPHGRRLAGAVRAEQPEHLALGYLEVDSLDGLDSARVCLAKRRVPRWRACSVPPVTSVVSGTSPL